MTRLKASKSAKRWRAGHSSSSNPTVYKFRNQAKSRRLGGHVSDKPSELTAEALARHDDQLESDITMTKEDDQSTATGNKSAWTLETDFVGGAYDGTAFHSVQRLWNSTLASHRQICAVLAAVTEVIESQGGLKTDNEYFAALITALESADNEDTATALAYLLSIVIDRISPVVLKSKFSLCSKVLSDKLRVYVSTQTSSLLKSLISCLATLLAAQEKAVWSESSTVQMLLSLLSHTVSSKPKVRKAAQQAICKLVKTAPKSVISNEVASFCMRELEKHGGSNDSGKAVYSLALLRDVIVMFSRKILKSSCECLLRLMTLGNTVVTGLVMQVFMSLFKSESADLLTQLNAQLINALYDYRPSVKDMQPLQAWLTVMQSAHVNLQRLDYQLCYTHLPRLVSTCVTCLMSPYDMIIQVASEVMKDVLLKCISPHVEKVLLSVGGHLKGRNNILEKIFRSIESGLKYRYHAAWCEVLGIIQVAFEVMGKACSDVIVPQVLVSLCNLHEIPNFSYIPQLEAAVGAAIKAVGPRLVLEAIPLELEKEDASTEFPRAWLLPVLKRYTQQTELNFFTTTLLPLAARLRNKAATLSDSHRKLEAKMYDTLQSQIWSLLPSFCRNPVDLKQSFKNIAQVLGMALNERPELRKTICHALCLLIKGGKGTDEQTVLSHFSKNFLPILFNLHTSESVATNSSLLSCVAAYLSISDQQLVNSLFGKVGVKLTSQDVNTATRQAVMDLALLMVPYVSQKSLSMLYKAISVLLESDDNALQKRTYKILERMCCCEGDQHQSFVESHLDTLQTSLLTSLSSAAASSKKPRLKCLSAIVRRLREDGTNFISSVTPEVILCTKEVNEEARSEAYKLLVELANAQDRCCTGTREVNITQYFYLVLAGLAATSPHMLSATILSLGRLAYEFRDLLSHSMIQKLLGSMNVFLTSRSREVVKATLGFIKVIVSILEPSDLIPHVQELVANIVSWSKDTKYHFRQQSRVLFERLVRKLGYELIFGLVPESHRKLVTHIRKTTERANRQKARKQESGDKHVLQSYEEMLYSSEDEEQTKHKKSRKEQAAGNKGKRKKSEQQAWIQEGPEDEPIDLLDRNASKRVLATYPSIHQPKVQSDQFEMSSDGKLIIKEDEEVVEVSNSDKVESSSKISSRKRKRVRSKSEGLEDVAMDMEETEAKRPYLGIHRTTLAGQMKFPDYGVDYRAKKAKGDMKLKGKADPYAYVPLDFRKLNKRKQAKLTGQFHGLLSAASKGAQRAQKSRTRSHVLRKHLKKSNKRSSRK